MMKEYLKVTMNTKSVYRKNVKHNYPTYTKVSYSKKSILEIQKDLTETKLS